MRRFFFALLMAACVSSHAAQWEVGVGGALAQPVGDGGWYQEGLPHSLNLRSPSFMVGLTDDISPGWAWHAQFVRLGNFSSDAQACDRDEFYSSATKTALPGCNVARYVGRGSANGIALTAERHATTHGFRFGAEAGPYLFKPSWHVDVTNWKASPDGPGIHITADNPGRLKVGYVVGVSVGSGPWGLSLRQYGNKCTPSTDACLWRSMRTLMLTYRF